MRRNALSWHVVVHCQLIEIAMVAKEIVIHLAFLLFLTSIFCDLSVLRNMRFFIQLESFQDLCNSWLHKREEIRHRSHILVYVNIVSAVLEFIPEVLHSSVQQLFPLALVECGYY